MDRTQAHVEGCIVIKRLQPPTSMGPRFPSIKEKSDFLSHLFIWLHWVLAVALGIFTVA